MQPAQLPPTELHGATPPAARARKPGLLGLRTPLRLGVQGSIMRPVYSGRPPLMVALRRRFRSEICTCQRGKQHAVRR